MFELIWNRKFAKKAENNNEKNEAQVEEKKEVDKKLLAIEAQKELDRLRVELLQLSLQDQSNHHRMGVIFNYVVNRKLAETAGHSSAQAYFCEKIRDLSPATLFMYGAVAKHFSENVCKQFGVTCLHLLLIYEKAASITVKHAEPGGTVVEVPGDNHVVTPKPFYACSVAELRKAIQHKRKSTDVTPLSEVDRALAVRYLEALEGRFPKDSLVRVQVRNQKGKAVFDLKGIPLAEMGLLAETLMSQIRVVPEAPEEEKAPQ
jgi:hypothetical protein